MCAVISSLFLSSSKNRKKMKRKIFAYLRNTTLLGLAIAGCATSSFAQKNAGSDTITSRRGTKIFIVEEHANKMKIIAQAHFFKLECNTGDAFQIGAGIEGDYFLPKFASA